MMKKIILAILGLSFALFVSSCEDKEKRTKKKVSEHQVYNSELITTVEREPRHHTKW